MQIKKCYDKIINGEKSIFLMGPVSKIRKGENWYDFALSYIEKAGYDGIVYNPIDDCDDLDINIWRMKALKNSTVACFWVPRNNFDMQGLDVNVYFGQCLNYDKLIYGRPDGSYMVNDLDKLYMLTKNEAPYEELKKLMIDTVNKTNSLYSMNKFDAIKYLSDNYPLVFKEIGENLSREERNYIISNLDIEKTCSNCTEYCCGGLNGCDRWNNDDIVGKVKTIKYLK